MKGLYILDPETGITLWTDDGYGTLFSQPVVVNGTVFSTYVSGQVVAGRINTTAQIGSEK